MSLTPSNAKDDAVEAVARAINDALDPLSGDPIGVVIHMSDHLFWEGIEGKTDIESQREAVMEVCRAAARAAIEAMRAVSPNPSAVEAVKAAFLEGWERGITHDYEFVTGGEAEQDWERSAALAALNVATAQGQGVTPCPECTGLTAHLPMCPSRNL